MGTNKQMVSSALIQYSAAVKALFPASCIQRNSYGHNNEPQQ